MNFENIFNIYYDF